MPAIRSQVLKGIMAYCGISESELHLLYGVLDDAETRARRLARARELGERYFGVDGTGR